MLTPELILQLENTRREWEDIKHEMLRTRLDAINNAVDDIEQKLMGALKRIEELEADHD
jgi:hypothetical protein